MILKSKQMSDHAEELRVWAKEAVLIDTTITFLELAKEYDGFAKQYEALERQAEMFPVTRQL